MRQNNTIDALIKGAIQSILPVVAGIVLYAVNTADAATSGWSVDGRVGMYCNNNASDGYVTLSVYMKNNANGFTIEEGTVYTDNILNTVYEQTQIHNTFSGTFDEFLSEVSRGINETDSEVKGLDYTLNANGIDTFSKGGRNADDFVSTDQNPNKDSAIDQYYFPVSMVNWNGGVFSTSDGDGLELVQGDSYIAWAGQRGIDTITGETDWIASAPPGRLLLSGVDLSSSINLEVTSENYYSLDIGRRFHVVISTNLVIDSWTTNGFFYTLTNEFTTVAVTNLSSSCFFRLVEVGD